MRKSINETISEKKFKHSILSIVSRVLSVSFFFLFFVISPNLFICLQQVFYMFGTVLKIWVILCKPNLWFWCTISFIFKSNILNGTKISQSEYCIMVSENFKYFEWLTEFIKVLHRWYQMFFYLLLFLTFLLQILFVLTTVENIDIWFLTYYEISKWRINFLSCFSMF
jgi:hypothetical protein